MTDLRNFLAKLHNNLNLLHEREAKYAGNAQLELLNQVSDHEVAIALTKQAIAGELSEAEWHEALKPLLVAYRNIPEKGAARNFVYRAVLAVPQAGDRAHGYRVARWYSQ